MGGSRSIYNGKRRFGYLRRKFQLAAAGWAGLSVQLNSSPPDNPASEPQSRSIAGRESAAQGAASTGSIGAIHYQLPGLFAVGPPRTATTWLDRVLRRSNSVSLAERIKETNFFAGDFWRD